MRKFFVLFFIVIVVSGCATSREPVGTVYESYSQTLYSPLHFVDQKEMWDDAECAKRHVYLDITSAEEESLLRSSGRFSQVKRVALKSREPVVAMDGMYVYIAKAAEFPDYYVVWDLYARVDGKYVSDAHMLKHTDEKICK